MQSFITIGTTVYLGAMTDMGTFSRFVVNEGDANEFTLDMDNGYLREQQDRGRAFSVSGNNGGGVESALDYRSTITIDASGIGAGTLDSEDGLTEYEDGDRADTNAAGKLVVRSSPTGNTLSLQSEIVGQLLIVSRGDEFDWCFISCSAADQANSLVAVAAS